MEWSGVVVLDLERERLNLATFITSPLQVNIILFHKQEKPKSDHSVVIFFLSLLYFLLLPYLTLPHLTSALIACWMDIGM